MLGKEKKFFMKKKKKKKKNNWATENVEVKR